jgi:diguanylate cyclase (GGDEF)-like protein
MKCARPPADNPPCPLTLALEPDMSSLDKALTSLLDLGNPTVRRERAEQLDQTLRTLLALTEGDATAIMLPGRGERLVLHSGSAAPSIVPATAAGSEVVRALALDPHPIVIADLVDDAHFAASDACPGVDAGPALFAALRRRGSECGCLAVYRRRGRARFNAADARAIVLLATTLQHSLEALRLSRGLEKFAFTDDLTEVYNARFVKSALKREVRRAARFGQELSLLLVEGDAVQSVVEAGATASDDRIKELAAQLVPQVRSFDFVARFDAGQFLVVLPQTGRPGAIEVAERIRLAVESHAFVGARTGAVTVSVGVAAFPQDGAEVPMLLATAARSLDGLRREGGNRIDSRLDRAEPTLRVRRAG